MTQRRHFFFPTFILLIFIPANFLFALESHPAHKEWGKRKKGISVYFVLIIYKELCSFHLCYLIHSFKTDQWDSLYFYLKFLFLLPLKQIRHREGMPLFSATQLMMNAVGVFVPDIILQSLNKIFTIVSHFTCLIYHAISYSVSNI